MAHLPSLGPRATLIDAFKAFPDTGRPLIEFHEALMRGSSPFSEAERELLAAFVSGLNRCRYCLRCIRQRPSGWALRKVSLTV